jgi:threonine dehydrogenase-like Zn-dependent dehydrogenase
MESERRIVFTGKGQVELEAYDPEPIRTGTVRIKAKTSLISTGTEGICFLRNFEPGSHWDEWVKSYPFRTGYILVGTVAEIGEGGEKDQWEKGSEENEGNRKEPEGIESRLKVGQLVAVRTPHASDSVVDAKNVHPVPNDILAADALWFALATVGFMGAKNAKFHLGDFIAVVGAGPVGQMAIRWAAAAGARHVAAIDPVAWRLELAAQGGASATFQGTAETARDWLATVDQGRMPDTVVDATGHTAVFDKCLALPRDRGRVLLLGDTGEPTQQHLTKDVLRRGLEIVGAHIYHEEGIWDERAVVRLFFDLHRRGRFPVKGLNTHIFVPEDCRMAYGLLVEGREETMGIRFAWDE